MDEGPDSATPLERLEKASEALSMSPSEMSALEALLSDPVSGSKAEKLLRKVHADAQALLKFVGLSASISAQNVAALHEINAHDISSSPAVLRVEKAVESTSGKTGRRSPSDAFDYTLYHGISAKRKGRPVSQKALYELLSALESSTKDGSLISKTNRLKKNGYLAWQRAKDLQITDLGKEEMERLRAHLSDEDIANIKRAFREAWDGMEIEIR